MVSAISIPCFPGFGMMNPVNMSMFEDLFTMKQTRPVWKDRTQSTTFLNVGELWLWVPFRIGCVSYDSSSYPLMFGISPILRMQLRFFLYNIITLYQPPKKSTKSKLLISICWILLEGYYLGDHPTEAVSQTLGSKSRIHGCIPYNWVEN
jgi:hypothetical protein